MDGKFDAIRAHKRTKKQRYALKLVIASIFLVLTLIGDYGPSIAKDFPEWLRDVSLGLTLPALLILGLVEGGKRALIGFLKTSAKYLFQASGAVFALVLTDKLATGPDIRLYSEYFLLGYVATVVPIRLRFRMSWWSLQYDLLFYRFIYWFITILIAVFSPLVLPFIPYLNLPGLASKLAIVVVIIILLSLVGIFLRLADIFKYIEESRVKSYWKEYATPDYDAMLMEEEFKHHPEIPVSRWQRIRIRLSHLFGFHSKTS